ncbi:MAG: hypothetical protein ACLTZM_20065 [Ruminococcus sp.]
MGKSTFGVVYNPFTEELFYGAKGEGALSEWNSYPCVRPAGIQDAVVSFGSSPYEKNRAKELFPVFYNIFMNCADFGAHRLCCS